MPLSPFFCSKPLVRSSSLLGHHSVTFPPAAVVFRMRHHAPDEDDASVVMDRRNQAKFISANVEHDELADQVRAGIGAFHIGELLPLRVPDPLMPSLQGALGFRVPGPEVPKLLFGDDSQDLCIFLRPFLRPDSNWIIFAKCEGVKLEIP